MKTNIFKNVAIALGLLLMGTQHTLNAAAAVDVFRSNSPELAIAGELAEASDTILKRIFANDVASLTAVNSQALIDAFNHYLGLAITPGSGLNAVWANLRPVHAALISTTNLPNGKAAVILMGVFKIFDRIKVISQGASLYAVNKKIKTYFSMKANCDALINLLATSAQESIRETIISGSANFVTVMGGINGLYNFHTTIASATTPVLGAEVEAIRLGHDSINKSAPDASALFIKLKRTNRLLWGACAFLGLGLGLFVFDSLNPAQLQHIAVVGFAK